MARKQKYLHTDVVDKLSHASFQALIPGMIITFKYTDQNAFDKYPLVLYLWNEKDRDLVHGLNLNYLTRYKMKRLFQILNADKRTEVVQKINDADTTLYERYTWVKLPGFSTGHKTRESHASMIELYNTVIKQKLLPDQGDNIYRTYKRSKTSGLKVASLRDALMRT